MTWTAVAMAKGPKIMLHSGAELDLLDPATSDFTIADIAHGLSLLCRYAGQCSGFYSVAEHCLHVSAVTPEHAFAALMHDAAEAFVGDVTRPLKRLLPQFQEIERTIEHAIFVRFGVPMPMPSAVKRSDLAVLAAEQAQIMPVGTDRWAEEAGIRPAPIKVAFLSPSDAKAAFLDRFEAVRRTDPLRMAAVA